jgi:hypothetical protein
MPHIYPDAPKLQGLPKVGNGDCVELVQHFTDVGWTGSWHPWIKVLDAGYIRIGTVIATFNKYSRYANNPRGNHAAFFMGMGPLDLKTGRPRYFLVMDQWKNKTMIGQREILPRDKLKEDGGLYDDSDNAETFWVVF